MRDETLAELLRSPLDEPPEPGGRSWLASALAGAVLGALLASMWVGSRGGEETVVVATTASVADAGAASPTFPAGFAPVADTTAMRPVLLDDRGDSILVVLTTVAEAGTPPEVSPVFPGGVWELRDVEGRATQSYEEIRNPAALGTVAVRFSGGGSAARTLVLTPLTEAEVITASVPIDLPDFPFATGRSFEVPLATGLRLSVLLASLDEEGGDVRWSLSGADALAQVDLVVTLPETEGDDGVATAMMSEHVAPPYPFQRQRMPRPAPLEGGFDVVRRVGPEIADPEAVTQAVVDVTVYLYRTREDAVVEFDLSDLVG